MTGSLSSNRSVVDPIYVLRGFESSVSYCEFTINGDFLLIGETNGNLSIWSMKDMRKKVEHRIFDSSILFVKEIPLTCQSQHHALTDDTNNGPHEQHGVLTQIICQGRNDCIKVLSSNDLSLRFDLRSEDSGTLNFCKVTCWIDQVVDDVLLAYPQGKLGYMVSLYSVKRKSRISKDIGDKSLGMVMSIKLLKQSSTLMLISGYESGQVIVWDPQSKNRFFSFSCFQDPIMSLDAFENQILVCGPQDTVLCLYLRYDVIENNIIHSLELEKCEKSETLGEQEGCGVVTFRADGKLVAVGSWRGQVHLLTKKYKKLGTLHYHKEIISHICFSSSNYQFAASSMDKKVSIWNIYSKVKRT